MFDLIFANKEWLFSGVGVVFIIAIIHFFRSRGLLHRLFVRLSRSPICPISPKEIYDSASTVPDLKKWEVLKNYVGLRVIWLTTLASSTSESENAKSVNLQLNFHSGSITVLPINCSVRLAHYPELVTAKEGKLVLVIGRIHSIDEKGIGLKYAQLIFS